MADRRTVLVTGATGQQGGAVARELLTHGYAVRAMTRKPESDKARALGSLGAQIIQGNLDDASSVERAFEGVWGAFGVQNSWEAGVAGEEEQGKQLAKIAHRTGVQHFVYTSVGSAHRATGIPHFDNKWRVEETVRSLGFPSHAIVRPVFFMENFLAPWFKPALDEGKLMIAIKPSTKLQLIAVDDIGAFGLKLFQDAQRVNGRAVDIAGDEMTTPEAAAVLSEAMGKSIEFVQMPIEQVRSSSEDFALMLEWFDKVGYDIDVPALTREYGIRPKTLRDWASKVVW